MVRVLLAIDESKFSEAAIQLVAAQNRPDNAEVRVVHVAEMISFLYPPTMGVEYLPIPPLDEVRKERLKKGQELVTAAASQLRAAGFPVDTAVREGDARAEILDEAERWKADLIVVGSHGRKGLDRFLIGSVSEYVARHARCSVEIVRLPAKP